MNESFHIGLIPLDERPVNTRYPAMLAEIAGVELHMPPTALLSAQKHPADCAALAEWLRQIAPQLDSLIVSVEMFAYGSLISSRISHEPLAAILQRFDALRHLKEQRPALQVDGFNLITRISNANDATEEPDYWDHYGVLLYRFSQLVDEAQQGRDVAAQLLQVEAAIPAQIRRDFVRRRARNHTLNLAALQLVANGVFDRLVLSSDDTSPFGLPSREKRWLAEWASRLELGDRLLMYPGADEVGCALLARAINWRRGAIPAIEVSYYPADADQIVAAFEDGPIRTTVERQVHAVGGQVVERDGEIWMAVNAPVARRSEWHPDFAVQERDDRKETLDALVHEVTRRIQNGQPVIVADVAYPNGADPALLDLLLRHTPIEHLAAYGAWNTAGNTIGTALAQACVALAAHNPGQRLAQQRFLLHRFVEDWGYQHLVRAEMHAELGESSLLNAEQRQWVCAQIELRLNALIERLPGFAGRWRIAPGSVRLPWQRLFEVDFELNEES